MKLTISTLTCPEWDLPRIIQACRENGIEGIDFRGLGHEIDITRSAAFGADLDQTLADLREQQLSLPCFHTSVTLVSPGPQRWQDMLDETYRYASLAQKTGTPYLRIFGGAIPKGITPDEALAMAQRHLRQVVKICHTHNTLPLLETHDVYATSAAMRRLVHEFAPDEVGVLWDVEHPYRAGELPAQTVTELARYIRHVHIKDSRAADGKNVPQLLGEGDLPLKEMLDALRPMNYSGWICLETEKRWHEQAPGPEESIPRFARYMREKWNVHGRRS